jgi:type IV pilus assembly protein PilY1
MNINMKVTGRPIMQRFYTALVAATAVWVGSTPAVAEDIDLFVQPPSIATGLPNVLIVLDNTANWNDPFTEQMAALVDTFNSLDTDDDGNAKFRVGLMLFTESGGANKGEDGGYVRAAIRDMSAVNQAKYAALIGSLDKNNDKSNGGKAGKTMADAYQYFSGLAPLTGAQKSKTDYVANVFGSAQSKAIYALTGNALQGFNTSPYNSPVISGSCAGNYIIYVSNGPVQDNTADNTKATTWLSAAASAAGVTGATTQMSLSPTGSQSNVADEWARFMKNSPRRITTYTIDVKPKVTGQTPGWTALLKSMADSSGGKYFDGGSGSNGDDIRAAMGTIFSEIQAVNSVFASVSLPVSVNTEGTYLNQVYIGMFRPDQKALPRWAGNLKQYKLGIVNDQLRTLDADDALAINSSTGFITECARSFWTPTTADSYWAFRPQGGCKISGTSYDNSNSPDGKIVEKGAQAYVLRSTTTRLVRTCSSVFASCDSPGALLNFATTNVSKTALGEAGMTDTEHANVVAWQRGIDNLDENGNGVLTTEMRPSAHGDVVHSRPIALDFGVDLNGSGQVDFSESRVVVFYGGNDGLLRAINGSRDVTFDGVAPGKEIWSFVPPEFHSSILRLRKNDTTINFRGNPNQDDDPDNDITPAPQPKPYGMDGPITAYQKQSLFVGMRRGGRALYAFDINNIVGIPSASPAVAPEEPDLLWKVGCPNNLAPETDPDDQADSLDDNCTSSDFEDMGQTWSSARVFKAAGYVDASTSVPLPMVIMGGGYDPCEDLDPVSDDCRDNGKGHAIFVLDATDGSLLKKFQTERGVVGDVFVVNDTNGLAKWAYAADLGGNIYRISGDTASAPIGATDPDDWTVTKIADLGCSGISACEDNRKFMFMPDIVEKSGTYYLLLGSGDREKPLSIDENGDPYWETAYDTTNHFFMVMDNPGNSSWLSSENSNCSTDVICLDSLLEIGPDNPDPDDLAAKKGWYLDLNDHEQVVTSAITLFGTTTFSTHTPFVPVEGQCSATLGTARVYNVRFLNASPRVGDDRSAVISGGGLPPSPVAGKVTLDNGKTVPFVIGSSANSALEASLPNSPSTGTQPKSLTYWYIEK